MALLRFDCRRVLLSITLLLLLVWGASAQTTSNCTTAANTLAPCLTYVTGSDATPSLLCCSAIAILNVNNPECLCEVVAQLSANSAVNATKVSALPAACDVPVNTTSCAAVPPGSSIGVPPGVLPFTPPPPSPSGSGVAGGARPSVTVAAVVALGVLAPVVTQFFSGFDDWFY